MYKVICFFTCCLPKAPDASYPVEVAILAASAVAAAVVAALVVIELVLTAAATAAAAVPLF